MRTDCRDPGDPARIVVARPTGARQFQRLYSLCDQLTGVVLCGMAVFSPWAFGTTQPWSIQTMNAGGLILGSLIIIKWAIRRFTVYRPATFRDQAKDPAAFAEDDSTSHPAPSSIGLPLSLETLLGAVTVLLLAYSFVSAVNARSTLAADHLRFEYHKSVLWLPHSYDATLSWGAFWEYLALAATFWAMRDWLLVRTSADELMLQRSGVKSALNHRCYIPRRLKLVLWVVCLSGALLALEGLLQRIVGDGRLLWLVEPRFNQDAESQFGPYAYRSNAAQLFLMLWPMAVGFWWLLRRQAHFFSKGLKLHNNLLVCALMMALVPLISLSRAGTVLGLLSLSAVLAALVWYQGRHSKTVWIIASLLGVVLGLGVALGWPQIESRFRHEALESQRYETWRHTWEIVQDFPVFGTGPGTFRSIYGLYRSSVMEDWDAYAHNDWLETLMTFGLVGTTLVLVALGLVLAGRFRGTGIHLHRLFAQCLYIGLGSCLLYALVDFPFQVYSVFFLFVFECAILSCLSRG